MSLGNPLFLSILISFVELSPFASAQVVYHESPVAGCVLDRLRAWEEEKLRIEFEETPLPERIEAITLGTAEALRDFNIGVQNFQNEWNEKTFREIREIASLGKVEKLNKNLKDSFNTKLKEARASLKTLRFLYIALSKGHEAPSDLSELTIALGKVRDDIQGKRGGIENLSNSAKRLSVALDKMESIRREIREFVPANRENFSRWFRKTIRKTRKIISKKSGLPREFHQARKNIQTLLSVYETEIEFHPQNEDWKKVARFLLKQGEILGDENEDWERADSRGEIDYNRDHVRYPRKATREIKYFLDRIQ